jgi:hypothetical protein
MRGTIPRLAFIAAAVVATACQDDRPEIVSPQNDDIAFHRAAGGQGPTVRITSPLDGETVASGIGVEGAGSLTGGSAFVITIETVTRSPAAVPATESINIRNTALLGQPNPNFPGLTVLVDADLITPDSAIIPANTNLANLFNVLGTDDTPGDGVTIWTGWHFLESFPAGVKHFTIRATIRDTDGREDTDVVRIAVDRNTRAAGQELTPAPQPVLGDGVDDLDGPEVTLVGPRDPSSLAVGTPTAGSLVFFQVSALDRTGAGIGVNENGAGITVPVGLIRDGSQIPLAGPNRNIPGLEFTFDVPLLQPNGNLVPAGQNLAPLFDVAGSVVDRGGRDRGFDPADTRSADGRGASGHNDSGRQGPNRRQRIRTTVDWVVGGSLVLEGRTSVTVTARVTDHAGKTGSVSRKFAISAVSDGQGLTPAP